MARSATGSITLTPLILPKVKPHNSLPEIILAAIKRQGSLLKKGDILAVASKVVSTCEDRIVRLDRIRVSSRGRHLGHEWHLNSRLTQLIIREADEVLGGVNGFLLTTKTGILTANAGVDLKNTPLGTAILWPANPDRTALELRKYLENHFKVRIGVVIVDSRVTPMRLGTIGLAIGMSGFIPVGDQRGRADLYGRQVKVTQTNFADDIAASAHLLMGETVERIGAVIVQNAGVKLSTSTDSKMLGLQRAKCLIANNLRKRRN
jgi:coenzyme F420-0:L-glutamate ligase/coenzyme F420-1:gamma-L-glutamate ligase